MKMNREFIAFVHIEKAAGTTLNHILRLNFFLKHCDVRPLSKYRIDTFSCSDLKKYIQINPFIKSISGHSIKPYSNLKNEFDIKYITIFRNPSERYVSQYLYLKKIGRINYTFESFLSDERYSNFQIKKISRNENFNEAKKVLEKTFLLIGVTEEFDKFLVQLQNKITDFQFLPFYSKQNITNMGSGNPQKKLLKNYNSKIQERNAKDIELYQFVKNVIIPKQDQAFNPKVHTDIESFKKRNQYFKKNYRRYIDYIYRKTYLDPITKMIRRVNGLPKFGSYTYD